MNIHKIELSGYTARVAGCEPLCLGTAGSRGNETLQIVLGDGWQGLSVQAVFHPAGVACLVPEDGLLAVPWEATEKALSSMQGRIVFQGLDGSGRVVNSTDAAYQVAAHSPTEGAAGEEPTPSLYEQFVKQVLDAAGTASDAAKQAGQSATDASRSETAAADAATSATTAAKQADTSAQAAASSAKAAADTLEQLNTKANAALTDIDDAKTKALTALTDEGTAQKKAVTDAGKKALDDLETARKAAEDGLTKTGNAQKQAVQDAGTSALDQIKTAGQNQTDRVNKAGEDKLAQIDAVNAHPPIVQDGTLWTWDTASGAYTDTGLTVEGEDGGYYTPSVDGSGNLSWTASKSGMPPVEGANIRGPQGPAGTSADPAQIDALYNVLANKCATKAELDQLFVDWWHGQWVEGESTYNSMLARWFGNVLHDDRVHGVKMPLFATSSSPTGEKTDDSVGLVCEPSTEAEAKRDDFAHLAQFWCVEVAVEKNADGTHTIYACEFIDPLDVVRAGGPDDGRHLVWVLQKNTYTREWDEDGYRYFKMRCDPAEGWETWPQGTDRQKYVYPYMANPKYGAGLEDDGTIGCRTGLPPVNYSSHNNNVTLWRKRGSQYAGASGNLLKFQLAMIWLKYGVKGNSGTIEGHSSQNLQYAAAVSESGVQRILLTTAQASNFKVGYNVIVGVPGSGDNKDRGQASMYSIRRNKRVTKIETVQIESENYGAVYVEDGDNTFDTTAGTTYISNMPYWSGWNDTVQGNDGSRYNNTNGHDTGLIQKTEFQNGAYLILADELWQWGTDEDGNFTFDCYTCHDQTKVTTNGSISGDYTKQEDLTLTFPAGTPDAWWYIEDTAIAADRGVLWPAKVSTAAGSGTGVKDGFYLAPRTSGVRAGWCCCNLNNSGNAGLAARYSTNGATFANWHGCAGAPGLSG